MKPLKNLKITMSALALCLFITSCSKKDKFTVTETKLVKIEQDANNYTSLTYNADNSLAVLKEVEDSRVTSTTFTYNDDKKVASAKVFSAKLQFVYNANKQLARIDVVSDQNGTIIGKTDFTYQNNILTETLISTKLTTVLTPTTKITYEYFANGDVKSITTFFATNQQFSVLSKHVFEYDNKVNPLRFGADLFSGLSWNASAHNITKETIYDENQEVTEVITTSYTYNPTTGLPLTAVETSKPVFSPETTINRKFSYQ